MGKHVQNSSFTPVQQFAADGSVLANLPARVHPAEQLLKQAVWWIDAAHSSASGQSVSNLGWGGSALDAQVGSTGSADSNDPKYLAWDGENYVYLPGVAGNYLSVPDEAALDITGDIDIRVKVALDDWTPADDTALVSKWTGTAATNAFYLRVRTTGKVDLQITSGGSQIGYTSTVATGVSDGQAKWVRATLDVDNGSSQSEAKFYTSDDGVSWSQLGSSVTHASTVSLQTNSSALQIGALITTVFPATAKFYRAQVLNGIDGTPVLDIDCSQISSGADTSFTALTGQTVSINRSTSGRKSVAVTGPVWLFGTDDYMQVVGTDSATSLVDFGATDSFTALVVARTWNTPYTSGPYLSKRNSAGDFKGWELRHNSTTLNKRASINDGTNGVTQDGPTTPSSGVLDVYVGTLDRGAATFAVTSGGGSASASASSVGDISVTQNLKVGKAGGPYYQDFEFTAAAVWRRALTAGEISEITNYYKERIG